MGNLLTILFEPTDEEKIEDIQEMISNTKKFKKYQDMFGKLTPSWDIYLFEGELIIETISDKTYAIHKYCYNWFDSKSVKQMYDQLDKLYVNFSK